MIKKIVVFFLFLLVYFLPHKTFAATPSCENRYLTIVNPVRSRNLWFDKSLRPLLDQKAAIQKNTYHATWLLQYDTFSDTKLTDEIKKFDPTQEKGVFLEISRNLAQNAGVMYPRDAVWYSPHAVFLSGYSQSERRRLIDVIFKEFKKTYGYYPTSVGAWWIDSYSLSYLRSTYGVTAAMIVADQLSTDNYGVWGQWFGVPYFPSKANILVPASTKQNKENVVVTQWAQRDPLRSYGNSPTYSNFSLQANDYVRQGKDTEYFLEIASVYLDCQNPLGQITVGLETGIESVGYIDEYRRQMDAVRTIPNLRPVTMSEFAKSFSSLYSENPEVIRLSYKDSVWEMTPHTRTNKKFSDTVSYQQNAAFQDYFLADSSPFLDRNLTKFSTRKVGSWFPWWIIGVSSTAIFAFWKKRYRAFWGSTLFGIACYGLIYRSFEQYGWGVYYGPIIQPLFLVQIVLPILLFFIFWQIEKVKRLKNISFLFLLWSLIFGVDVLLEVIRYTKLSSYQVVGVSLSTFHLFAIKYFPPFTVGIINQDFPGEIASAFFRFDFSQIWKNYFLAFVMYPFAHLIAGGMVYLILVRSPKFIRWGVVGILGILFLWYVSMLFTKDPLFVVLLR